MVISAFFGSKAKLKFKLSCILGILFVSRDEGWSGFRNQRNFCLWNMDSWASEPGGIPKKFFRPFGPQFGQEQIS